MAGPRHKQQTADIGKQQLGTIYAKALIGAAEKTGVTDALLAEFDALLEQVFDKFPGFEATLSSPQVPTADKLRILKRVFGGRMSEALHTFLDVVCEHGRLDCLREICHAAHRQVNEMRGRVEVHLTTAAPIDASMQGKITETLRSSLQSDVVVRPASDAELIGGMVVRVGDTVYDASVANALRRMRGDTLKETEEQIRESTDRFAVGQ